MNSIQLSFIVPVYNRPDEVRELLQSLTKQTDPVFELIIVEDGSTISSKPVIDEYAEKLQIQYHFKDNEGPSIGRNYGLARAKGDYFLFVDSDCILPPHYVKTVRDFLLNHSDVDAFGGPDRADAQFNALQKSISYSLTSFFTTGGIRGGKKQVDKFYPRSFNLGFSRKVYEQTNGFPDTKLHPGEDMILAIEIVKMGFKTALISDAFVYHKRRTSLNQFKRQVYRFGFVRFVISLMYPDTFKIFFLLPSLFTLGFFVALFLGLTARWELAILYALYFTLVFLDASIKNKSLRVGATAVCTTAIQMYGYGTGFLFSIWKRLTLGSTNFMTWAETYRG